jgi:uncharacterized cofD-like protein
VLLRGLKVWVGGPIRELTAVVTVSDDGGSSGRLRREFGILPPGDIRSCIVALADDEDLLARLFQYRFDEGEGLSGHSFGNLFLTALAGITGDFYEAILTAEAVLSVRGRILPATLSDLRLHAKGLSGRTYEGESAVGGSGEPLQEVLLEPQAPPGFGPAIEAIRQADLVVLGPGSLYTSVIANLLIPDIDAAIQESRGKVVLPLNLMTQPGETDGMSALDHLDAVERYLGSGVIDTVVVNTARLPKESLPAYREEGSEPVVVDDEAFRQRGVEIVGADLLAEGRLIRHDRFKLARAILSILKPEGAAEIDAVARSAD